MKNRFLNTPLYIWILFILFSLLFIFFPQIDLYVSKLFFNGHFWLKGSIFESILYYSVKPLLIFFALSSILIFLYNYFRHKNILSIDKKAIIFIVLFLSVAPGLIVNAVLKEHWGRARPNEIVQFGGTKEFTPAFIPSSHQGNSFSCGHGAAAFSLIGFALLAHRRRKFWMALALSYGVLVSIARIIGGGHFLSDTVTSFFIVYISTYFFYGLIMKREVS